MGLLADRASLKAREDGSEAALMWRKWGNCFRKQHNNVIGRSRTGHSGCRFGGYVATKLKCPPLCKVEMSHLVVW
jgi:hypothetical protein